MMMFSCQPFSSSSYADLSHDAFQYLICSFLVPSDLAFNFDRDAHSSQRGWSLAHVDEFLKKLYDHKFP
uniref:Uncharacterized protein n=1 Tax=Manihot esculenta TaxID=3983 RepID=A0A2C9WP53_MANES